jgi:hypothetical protein
VQALLSKLSSAGTFFKLPFIGSDVMKPLATDLSPHRAGPDRLAEVPRRTTLHCRLGGRPTGATSIPAKTTRP